MSRKGATTGSHSLLQAKQTQICILWLVVGNGIQQAMPESSLDLDTFQPGAFMEPDERYMQGQMCYVHP